MQIGQIITASALFAMANAIVQLTNSDFSGITAGTPFNITWSGNTGPVNLLLKSGPSTDLVTSGTIASGVTDNYYLWTPSISGTFAIEIQDGSDINYSSQFPVTGGTALASSSEATSTGTTTVVSTTSVTPVTTATSDSASESTSTTAIVINSTTTSTSMGSSNNTASRTSASLTPTRSPTSTSTSTPVNVNGAVQYASSFGLAALALAAFVGMN